MVTQDLDLELERASTATRTRIRSSLFSPRTSEALSDNTATAFMRPLMTPNQKGIFMCLAAVWLLVLMSFWAWWLEREHIAGFGRFFFNSALVLWATVSPGYFVMIFWRSTVAADLPMLPPDWRVAMVVTKAPSEPFAVVRETLEAMLRQAYRHDTWLADEDPSDETLAWCKRHGVSVSSRKGITDYHQPTWPRRTRCKEGNLAYFYDHYGYRLYDFVVQLDADHVPARNYLIEMLKPFRDERVGYVSAPSICDRNAADSWAARGRLDVEGGLHGALQAGYNGGLAPLCIGSHYGVRTAALRDIGGVGPELAEDHSTTLIMNAHGWRGVHAFNAIANGEGPPTFAAMVTQEFQWARSLSVILFRYTKDNWAGLTPRLKSQFLFSQLWYPIFSVFMACSVAAPIIALLTRHAWVAVLYPEFFVHSAIVTASIIGVMVWVRRNGWFRPTTARVLSWEGSLFTFARWPWSLLGVLTGAYAGIMHHDLSFRVTPKGGEAPAAAQPGVVLPYLALSVICALPVLFIDQPGTAAGFYLISLANSLIYVTIACVVMLMHPMENPQGDGPGGKQPRVSAVNLLALLGSIALVGTAAWLHLGPGVAALMRLARPAAEVHAGANPATAKPMFNFGAYDPQHQLAGAGNISVEHAFVSWTAPDVSSQIAASVQAAGKAGRWLLLTVEPWTATGLAPGALLTNVAQGRYDAQIDTVCDVLAKSEQGLNGRSGVFVRWGHEMDQTSTRYPWQTTRNDDYVDAYRHFVSRCRSRLGRSARVYFVWSPVGNDRLARYYPGKQYVDWIGLSVYDCTSCGSGDWGKAGSFEDIARPKYRRARFYGKPLMISEMGMDGDAAHQIAWLKDALVSTCAMPDLRMLVYFNALDAPGVWGSRRPDWHLHEKTLDAIRKVDPRSTCPESEAGS